MDDVKVYTPEIIEENPFPQDQIKADNTTTYSPTEIDDAPMPSPMIANELVSQSLNTQTQSILGKYSFTPTGAIQVGKFKENVSGDIRISPNGIVGRNSIGADGTNTFTIDGTTGDATFMGDLMAGSVIAGDSKVIIDSLDDNGRILLYDDVNVCRIVIGYVA